MMEKSELVDLIHKLDDEIKTLRAALKAERERNRKLSGDVERKGRGIMGQPT